MQYVRDADDQEKIEGQRLQEPPITPIEIDENSSNTDRMKAKLVEILHKNPSKDDDNTQLMNLLLILSEDEDPDDDIYQGKHGNYTISDDHVGGDLFKENTKNDSIENIQGVLEMATIAKSVFGDGAIFRPTSDDLEQDAMFAYASQLSDLKIHNQESSGELSPELKAKMDQAWENMSGIKAPEQNNDLDNNNALNVSTIQPLLATM